MLNLPDVTLVTVETQCHELARLAVADAVSKVNFGGVVIYTDHPEKIEVPGAECRTVPNWSNKIQFGEFYYQEAAQSAKTSHILMMEWDGGIRDVSSWRDDFLGYDLIGAPWVGQNAGHHGLSVGNGGFMLVSRKLADAVYAKRAEFHIATDMDLSRERRRYFEQAIGAKWAPEQVGFQFSYEHGYKPRASASPSFGYHDVFNWPLALDDTELVKRVHLIMNDPYIAYKTQKLRLLGNEWPRVRHLIGPAFIEAEGRYRRPAYLRHRIMNQQVFARRPQMVRTGIGVKA